MWGRGRRRGQEGTESSLGSLCHGLGGTSLMQELGILLVQATRLLINHHINHVIWASHCQ